MSALLGMRNAMVNIFKINSIYLYKKYIYFLSKVHFYYCLNGTNMQDTAVCIFAEDERSNTGL